MIFFLILLMFIIPGFEHFETKDRPIIANTLIKNNDIVSYDNQPLILIDFWATWCGPCRPATKQIEIYQNTHKQDFFAVAISDELYSTITNYLEHTPIQLMVLQDQDMYTFKKYEVYSRPYAVILNRAGKVVWSGHPGRLTSTIITNLANANNRVRSASLDEILTINAEVERRNVTERLLIMQSDKSSPTYSFIRDEQEVSFSGKLSELIATSLQVSPKQIRFENYDDIVVDFVAPIQFWQVNHATAVRILNEFSLALDFVFETRQVYALQLTDSSKLWDTTVIDWGEQTDGYMIGREELMVDNHSIQQLAVLLSKVRKDELFIYEGSELGIYDWSFSYSDFNVMKDEFEQVFGIILEKKNTEVPVYIIRN